MSVATALISLHTRLLSTSCAARTRPVRAFPVAARPAAAPRPRTASHGVRAMSSGGEDLVKMVESKNAENAVMVYSKTYCPYCSEVKSLFQRLGVDAKVVELDELADGAAVQDALATVTGRRTVPQVFIGGAHVGGCDDTMAAMNSGKLKALLEQAGVQAKL